MWDNECAHNYVIAEISAFYLWNFDSQARPAREMDVLKCSGYEMTVFIANYKNPWRLLYQSKRSPFKSFTITLDFVATYRVTLTIGTNANLKWYFCNHYSIHIMPARIMDETAQYYVCSMFMLYILWGNNGKPASATLMNI